MRPAKEERIGTVDPYPQDHSPAAYFAKNIGEYSSMCKEELIAQLNFLRRTHPLVPRPQPGDSNLTIAQMLLHVQFIIKTKGQLQGDPTMPPKKKAEAPATEKPAKTAAPAKKTPSKKGAEPAAPAEKASKASKAGGPGRNRRHALDAKIKILVKENPKRQGTEAFNKFEGYKNGMTVKEFLDNVGNTNDLSWDEKRGFISIG